MRVASQVAPGKPQILHCADMSDDERRRLHGSGRHDAPGTLTVSSPTTVTFAFEVGKQPVVTGGQLLVVWRWPFDWSDLQADDPASDGFMRVRFLPGPGRRDDEVELSPRYNWIAGIEPWHHQIQVRVTRGELRTGDRVELVCGDTSQGGGGWRAPTCAAERSRFLMLIDHAGDGNRVRLVDTPSFRLTPDTAVRIAAVVESDATIGAPVRLIVRAEDVWGNPTQLATPPTIEPIPTSGGVSIEPLETETVRPARHYNLSFAEGGTFQLRVAAGELAAVSNPVRVTDEEPELHLYWGDLHSGQTEIGCGAGSLTEHYAFGRDCAGLQFITHQANDHYVTRDDWDETRRVTEEFHEPGRYVPFLGCEWSPLHKDGGDRNVFYPSDEPVLRRSDRFFREDDPDPTPDIRTAPEFHDAFRDLDILVNIHVGGRMTNLEWYEPKIERLCETHSTHGTVEWFVMDALSRGGRVGLTAGTDGVMGRPGACRPGRRLIRNCTGGLTAVYAESLTREAIWEALKNRRCYATTGERIRLAFEVDGHPMGSEIETSGPLSVRIHVDGTQPLERVDLLRGSDVIESWPVAEPELSEPDPLLRVLWGGTERKGTARLQRVDWDGTLSVEEGTLAVVEEINFQACDDRVEQLDASSARVTSKTAGNAAGVVVRVSAGSRLTFASGPATVSVNADEILHEPKAIAAGGVNRFVHVGPAPRKDGPVEFEKTAMVEPHTQGVAPYWVRIVQIDQSCAWGSPVYVEAR